MMMIVSGIDVSASLIAQWKLIEMAIYVCKQRCNMYLCLSDESNFNENEIQDNYNENKIQDYYNENKIQDNCNENEIQDNYNEKEIQDNCNEDAKCPYWDLALWNIISSSKPLLAASPNAPEMITWSQV